MNPKITLTFSRSHLLQMALKEAVNFEPFTDQNLTALWVYDDSDQIVGIEVEIDDHEGEDLV